MRVATCVLIVLAIVCGVVPAAAAADETTDVALFHVFLEDGASVVSYGEYARVGDEVVFSTPLGRLTHPPRLQLLALPVSLVDWPRTERYAASVRHQRYIATRAEHDFTALTTDVAAVLNQITHATSPARAATLAGEARRRLVEWPAAHYGYREAEVRDIVALIDEAIDVLDPAGAAGRRFELSFVASAPLEPLLPMSASPEQVRVLMALAEGSARAADRANLLRAALAVMDAEEHGIDPGEAARIRRTLDERLRDEMAIDRRYARLVEQTLGTARREAERASVSGVEKLFDAVAREDARLGGVRPDTIRALRAALDAELDAVREFRLRHDQWQMRQQVYRRYVDGISAQVSRLTRARQDIEAIRALTGPTPRRIRALRRRLQGGADRLALTVAPESLRPAHDLLVAAWRFAEQAAETREGAMESADLPAARQASSAAAGSLLLLARAQAEIRALLDPPRFQR